MTKVMTIATATGLFGLVLAMIAALSGATPAVLALGFVMMVSGLIAAVIAAAASLGHAWQSAR